MKRIIISFICGVAVASGVTYAATTVSFMRAYNVDCQAVDEDKAIFCAKSVGNGVGVRFTSHDVLVYNLRTQIPLYSIAHSSKLAR